MLEMLITTFSFRWAVYSKPILQLIKQGKLPRTRFVT